jgi:hypothetical protein
VLTPQHLWSHQTSRRRWVHQLADQMPRCRWCVDAICRDLPTCSLRCPGYNEPGAMQLWMHEHCCVHLLAPVLVNMHCEAVCVLSVACPTFLLCLFTNHHLCMPPAGDGGARGAHRQGDGGRGHALQGRHLCWPHDQERQGAQQGRVPLAATKGLWSCSILCICHDAESATSLTCNRQQRSKLVHLDLAARWMYPHMADYPPTAVYTWPGSITAVYTWPGSITAVYTWPGSITQPHHLPPWQSHSRS